MNWRDFGKLTGGDMWFLLGALVGLGIAGVVLMAGFLWLLRVIGGG